MHVVVREEGTIGEIEQVQRCHRQADADPCCLASSQRREQGNY